MRGTCHFVVFVVSQFKDCRNTHASLSKLVTMVITSLFLIYSLNPGPGCSKLTQSLVNSLFKISDGNV